MARVLFEKKGNAIWISHLDTMRLFQRAFKRAGLPLTHSQGFNPRPSVSIALPLSVGVESHCELLDFELDGEAVPLAGMADKLNAALPAGVRVLDVYDNGRKIKELALLDCQIQLKYDRGVPEGCAQELRELFARESLVLEKKSKSGVLKEQNIVEMIRALDLTQSASDMLTITARICCQNPTLNPMQLVVAIEKYLPACKPDFVTCARLELYDTNEKIFR